MSYFIRNFVPAQHLQSTLELEYLTCRLVIPDTLKNETLKQSLLSLVLIDRD